VRYDLDCRSFVVISLCVCQFIHVCNIEQIAPPRFRYAPHLPRVNGFLPIPPLEVGGGNGYPQAVRYHAPLSEGLEAAPLIF
jgi:hypothetical protein